ncbi:hypothetical protein SDC9_00722 [bioreactor metagenome]|jgi:Flp pilus assembly CpaE family ATPase|uniref:Uncharacterized protein n=1 Tax=bioreactor metagenome TaxID=1076179 RepID=A0A644SNQ0_9ZZZZ
MKVKLIMNANDVQTITDYSIGHCRRILREIRKSKRKLKHQKVTVEEVSAYLGINADDIRKIFSKDH